MSNAHAGYLRNSMNPGIRATGAHNRNRTFLNIRECRFQASLNRRAGQLALPPHIPGPLIGDRELQSPHDRYEPQSRGESSASPERSLNFSTAASLYDKLREHEGNGTTSAREHAIRAS